MSSAALSGGENARASGKGRRRRAAAADLRRLEAQRMEGNPQDQGIVVAPAAPAGVAPTGAQRRRARRALRRETERAEAEARIDLELELEELYLAEREGDLDMALALSLSMAEAAGIPTPTTIISGGASSADELTYETLVELEDVRCTLTPAVVNSLHTSFVDNLLGVASSCVICQHDYVEGDDLVTLPCKHDFHHVCGSRWLLEYSRQCPVCKVVVTTN